MWNEQAIMNKSMPTVEIKMEDMPARRMQMMMMLWQVNLLQRHKKQRST
jgi:hypothetical protein